MPARPVWFQRVGAILEQLRSLPSPFLDRATVEQLFGLHRRRAHYLMGGWGGFQVGRTFLVARQDVIEALERVQAGDEFHRERKRKVKVWEAVETARRNFLARQVLIAAAPDAFNRRWSDLPPGVRLEAGELRVPFSSTEDLLGRLFELSQAIANDFEQFRRWTEGE